MLPIDRSFALRWRARQALRSQQHLQTSPFQLELLSLRSASTKRYIDDAASSLFAGISGFQLLKPSFNSNLLILPSLRNVAVHTFFDWCEFLNLERNRPQWQVFIKHLKAVNKAAHIFYYPAVRAGGECGVGI